MTERSGKTAVIGFLILYVVIPAVLGLLANTRVWLDVKAETAAAHARAESMFDPVE